MEGMVYADRCKALKVLSRLESMDKCFPLEEVAPAQILELTASPSEIPQLAGIQRTVRRRPLKRAEEFAPHVVMVQSPPLTTFIAEILSSMTESSPIEGNVVAQAVVAIHILVVQRHRTRWRSSFSMPWSTFPGAGVR